MYVPFSSHRQIPKTLHIAQIRHINVPCLQARDERIRDISVESRVLPSTHTGRHNVMIVKGDPGDIDCAAVSMGSDARTDARV